MEVHKILLEKVEIDIPEEYKAFIKPELREVVVGEPVKLRITIRNIGDETFPGGGVEKWEIHEYGAAFSLGHIISKPPPNKLAEMKVPKLAPNGSYQIEYELLLTVAGIAEVCIKMASEDKKPVQHFRHPQEGGENEFRFLLHAIDRETLKILLTLTKLLKKLEGSM
jgi:hypothetical protein